ncbi:MAG: hypothetical protein II882_09445 [Lachnospiraceae bacterium]|nr:hypothetical protein [Lachnospiraceae bacterium]
MKRKILYPIILTALCLLFLSGCTKTLKLADYADYQLEGYDGYGKLTDRFNFTALCADIAKAAGYRESSSNYDEKLRQITEEVRAGLVPAWSAADHLKNGSALTCRFELPDDFLKAYNVKLDPAPRSVTLPSNAFKAVRALQPDSVADLTLAGYSTIGRAAVRIRDSQFSALSCSVEPKDHLSNGDTVTVTLSIPDGLDLSEYLGELGYRLTEMSYSRTVSGLTEPELVDPFNYITVSFDGYSGTGTADYTADYRKNVMYELEFQLDKSSGLQNGDTVTLRVKPSWWNEQAAENILNYYGVVLTGFEKTYTVEGLPEAQPFDPFDYISLRFSGVSGVASAATAIDTAAPEDAQAILRDLTFSLDKSEDLSNGDVTTLTVSRRGTDDVSAYCMTAYGIVLTETAHAYTVAGLDEPVQLDPFDYVTVRFFGISGLGEAEAEVMSGKSVPDVMKVLRFRFDKSENLSLGDTVTLHADVNWYEVRDYCLRHYGVLLTETEKSFTVEGLSSYLTSLEDVPENELAGMITQASAVFENTVSTRWSRPESYQGLAYAGYYLLSRESVSAVSDNVYLVLIFRITAKDAGTGEDFEFFYYVRFKNILLEPDGSITADLSRYDVPSHTFSRSRVYYTGYETQEELYAAQIKPNLSAFSLEEGSPED